MNSFVSSKYPICFHCMSITNGKDECPRCNTPTKIYSRPEALRPYTVLQNRYIVGECFKKDIIGFSYLGIDHYKKKWVIIKECFPGEYEISSNRNLVNDLTVNGSYSGVFLNEHITSYTISNYYSYIISFINMCCNVPNILKKSNQLLSFFLDNNTAYAIFNYIQGKTLIEYINNLPEGISEASLLTIIMPILEIFKIFHKKKIFGFRISPNDIYIPDENDPFLTIPWQGEFDHVYSGISDDRLFEIPLQTDIKIYSIDLWSSNKTNKTKEKFSDIYSLSAIMYSCLQGDCVHPLQYNNLINSKVLPITKVSKQPISNKLSHAIMKGLEKEPKKRPQSIDEFKSLLPIHQS
ncbi:serine/threonine protein kinase [Candidatus Magnetomorum sp. HK-1]|nr:serine/threonine protein kinase [Candidatus Magnetomorum sp. HK-1]